MREGACWQVDTLTREIALNVRGPEGKSRARGHEGMRAGEWQCKGVNAAEPRAKVQRCEAEYRLWSVEYRKKHNSRGHHGGTGARPKDARGHVGKGTWARYEGMRAGWGQHPDSGG